MPPTRRNSNCGRSHGAQIISLLAITGLRTGEACRSDRADVDLHAGLLSVRDTGGMIWSGKVFASRGALRGAQGCVTRRRGQCACPATVPAQEGGTPGITKTVGQPGGGALGVVVAGYQRQLALCFVVHSDAAQSTRGRVGAPSGSASNTALKSLYRPLSCSLPADFMNMVRDLSARSLGSADHGQHPDRQRQRNKVSRPMARNPLAAPRRLTRGLRSGGTRGCCQSRWA